MDRENIEEVLKIEGINSKGFGIIPKAIMIDTNLSIEAKCIYAYLCSLSGNGITSYPKRDTIIKTLQISKDYYYKNLKLLLNQGYIKVTKTGDFPKKNVYTLVSKPMRYKKNENNNLLHQGIKALGFGAIPRTVMIDNRLNIKAKSIYGYLCSYLGNGETAFPKTETILYQLKISKNTYYKYFNQLIKYGYISTIQRKTEKGKFSINDFYINEKPCTKLQDIEKCNSEKPCTKLQDIEKCNPKKPCTKLQDIEKCNPKKPCTKLPCTKLPYTKLPYTKLQDTTINNNTINNNIINNQSYQSIDNDGLTDCNAKEKEYKNYNKIIKENIEYDVLKQRYEQDMNYIGILENIHNTLIKTIVSKKKTIKVAGEEMPINLIKAEFLKLRACHIDYVLDTLITTTSQISNMEAYLITVLYNANKTHNISSTIATNHLLKKHGVI